MGEGLRQSALKSRKEVDHCVTLSVLGNDFCAAQIYSQTHDYTYPAITNILVLISLDVIVLIRFKPCVF